MKQFKYQSQAMNRQLTLCYLLVLVCLICGAMGKGLPVSFLSAQHPKAVFIKLEVEENQSFGLWSPRINPDGDHWTRVNTQTDQLVFDPAIDAQAVLYNELHEGKQVLAFYGQLDNQKDQEQSQHFNIIQTQISGQLFGFLLPLFSNEVPSFRSDKLFRCQNTVISVEWRGDEAHVFAFSDINEQWNILDSIDGGYAGEDKGVRYSYAIDREHSSPVKVDLLGGQFCSIDQSTQAMELGHSWESDYLSLEGLLQLLPQKLDVKEKADSEEL